MAARWVVLAWDALELWQRRFDTIVYNVPKLDAMAATCRGDAWQVLEAGVVTTDSPMSVAEDARPLVRIDWVVEHGASVAETVPTDVGVVLDGVTLDEGPNDHAAFLAGLTRASGW